MDPADLLLKREKKNYTALLVPIAHTCTSTLLTVGLPSCHQGHNLNCAQFSCRDNTEGLF